MSNAALLASSGLVLFTLLISYWQHLKLEKEIFIGTVRAVVQLFLIGFVLKYIFDLNDWRFTLAMLLVMTVVASVNAAKRGKGIPRVLFITTSAILAGASITLAILITVQAIAFVPSETIPVAGMVIGNSMAATGLTLTRLRQAIEEKRWEIITSLSLGATPRQAVVVSLQKAIKMGMMPTIDSLKTMGIVQLPGMMTGLILAGTNPVIAVRYQIMVVFMISAAVSIFCFVASTLAYRSFFTAAYQLRTDLLTK